MPVRIYDLAKKLGVESKEVLAKAKELGITQAKVPSSHLDKITAEFLEEKMGGVKPAALVEIIKIVSDTLISLKHPIIVRDLADQLKRKPYQIMADLMEAGVFASVNQAISEEFAQMVCLKYGYQFKLLPEDSTEIPALGTAVRSAELKITGSDSPSKTPSVQVKIINSDIHKIAQKIITQELSFVLEIQEDEKTPSIRLCLIKEAIGDIGGTKIKQDFPPQLEITERTKDLLRAAYYKVRHHSQDEWINLASYGSALKQLEPDFHPEDFGERSLGTLLRRVLDVFEVRADEDKPLVYNIRLRQSGALSVSDKATPAVTLPERPTESDVAVPQGKATGKIHNLRIGFGFIVPDDEGENLFFHATDIIGCTIFDLRPGDAVEYEPGVNERGPCATNVIRLATANA